MGGPPSEGTVFLMNFQDEGNNAFSKSALAYVCRAGAAVQWWIGDWLNYGERRYGEVYAQALDATGLDYQTLRDVKWVCSTYPVSRRHDNLSFKHHREAAALPPAQADALLARAEAEGLSTRDVRAAVAQYKAAARLGVEAPSGECGRFDPAGWPVVGGRVRLSRAVGEHRAGAAVAPGNPVRGQAAGRVGATPGGSTGAGRQEAGTLRNRTGGFRWRHPR